MLAKSSKWGGRFLATVLLAGLAVAIATRDLSAEQKPDYPAGAVLVRTQVDLVMVHAAIFGRNQQMVTGLPREAFRIYQDKKLQKLTEFSNRDIPVSMGIILDSSASMVDKREKAHAAALALVRGSNPADEVFLVDFKDTVKLMQEFTSDIDELEASLSRIRLWGGTAVMDAVRMGLEHSAQGRLDKKVLLVITDGEDDSSEIRMDALLNLLRRSNVTIYTIGILSDATSRKRKNAEKFLKAVAKISGGASYFPQSVEEVEALASRIAHDIRNQYVLGYAIAPGTKTGYHSLKVDVRSKKHGKLSVRARPGFFYEAGGSRSVR